MLMEPYPESAKVIEDAGEGVKMGGLKPEDWDCVGDCSKAKLVKLGDMATVYCLDRQPVLRSTVAWVKKSRVTWASLSCLETEPVT